MTEEKGNTIQFKVSPNDDTFGMSRYWEKCIILYNNLWKGHGHFLVTIEFYPDSEVEDA